MDKTIVANVVTQAGRVALVQWLDDSSLRRSHVPADEVKRGRCKRDVLEAGIPYGVPWEEIVESIINAQIFHPAAFADELRKHDIWTADDVEKNPRGVKRAIAAITGVTIGALMRAARQYEEVK